MSKLAEKMNLNVYAQSSSLLFQFVSTEVLTTLTQLQKLEKIVDQGDCLQQTSLEDLLKILPLLTGLPPATISSHSFPWTQRRGSLNKLKLYTALLSENFPQNDTVSSLRVAASIAFHSALQVREVIVSLSGSPCEEMQIDHFKSLKMFLNKLIVHGHKMGESLKESLLLFKDDPRVFYFVIRHPEIIRFFSNNQGISALFQRLFPARPYQRALELSNAYREKGFYTISDRIEEIVLRHQGSLI